MWPRVFDWTRELDYRCCSSHGIPKESLQHARNAEIAWASRDGGTCFSK